MLHPPGGQAENLRPPTPAQVTRKLKFPNFSTKSNLKNTKQIFPEYKSIHSQVLQDVIQRVQTTFDNYLKPNINGKRSGKPKFISLKPLECNRLAFRTSAIQISNSLFRPKNTIFN